MDHDRLFKQLLTTFCVESIGLTKAEEVLYNQELNSLEPNERRAVVELMDVFTARRFRNGIALQLEHKFGALPMATRERIEDLPPESLEDMLVALLDFRRIADADAWIAKHSS